MKIDSNVIYDLIAKQIGEKMSSIDNMLSMININIGSIDSTLMNINSFLTDPYNNNSVQTLLQNIGNEISSCGSRNSDIAQLSTAIQTLATNIENLKK